MIDRHIGQAQKLAGLLRDAGFEVVNNVILNQVLVRGNTDEETLAIRAAVEASGEAWFGATVWRGRPAFRLSISSWRTRDEDIQALAELLTRVRNSL
jgi:glutamate/tyrosine decarboxylase-like PLP-dependent enzyme